MSKYKATSYSKCKKLEKDVFGEYKEYKTELETLKKEKDMIAKKLGETIVEKEFLKA